MPKMAPGTAREKAEIRAGGPLHAWPFTLQGALRDPHTPLPHQRKECLPLPAGHLHGLARPATRLRHLPPARPGARGLISAGGQPRLLTLGQTALEGVEGIGAGKPLALLVYLAAAEAPVSRRELARVLWADVPGPRALDSVRQALWVIRGALGPEALEGDDSVSLAPGALACDLADLRARLTVDPLEAASELIRLRQGAFLADFEIPDSQPFTRWVENTREEVDGAIAARLSEAATRALASGRSLEAVRYAEAAFDLSPHDAAINAARVEAYLATRSVDGAAAALREARERLAGLGQEDLLASLEERVSAARESDLSD